MIAQRRFRDPDGQIVKEGQEETNKLAKRRLSCIEKQSRTTGLVMSHASNLNQQRRLEQSVTSRLTAYQCTRLSATLNHNPRAIRCPLV